MIFWSSTINCTNLYCSSVLASNGSPANPSFTFLSESNTGMYRETLYTIAFSTLANKAMSISLTNIQMWRSLSTNGNTLSCGAITSSGAFDNGANAVTCGAITSSGAFSNGANSITCGLITISGASNNSMPYFDSAKEFKSVQLTNGQLMIGSTGNAPLHLQEQQIKLM